MLMKKCNEVGCSTLVPKGQKYCDKHKSKHPDYRQRESIQSKSPYYRTYRWKKESASYLKKHPICAVCGAKATEVHHDYRGIDDYNDEETFFNHCKWVPLCHECHSRITINQINRRKKEKYDSSSRERLWY